MINDAVAFSSWHRTGDIPKPPVGTNIDTSNPITSGMLRALSLSEGSGNSTYDAVTGTNLSSPSTLTWRGTGDQSGLDMRQLNEITVNIPSGTARTLLIVWKLESFTGYGNYGAPLGVKGGSNDTHGLRRNNGGGYDLVWFGESASAVPSGPGPSIAAGQQLTFAWGYDGTNVRGSVAIDGGAVTTVINSANATGTLAARTGIRTAFASDGVIDGTAMMIGIWNRWLSNAEILAIVNDPYSIFLY